MCCDETENVYNCINNYAMKCRLYPTKEQHQKIDRALTAVRVFHNCLVYDMWHNRLNVTEKRNNSETNEVVHFPDLEAALKADYKKSLIAKHPIIGECPASALTTNVGLKADLKREFGKSPIEYQKPTYYNERHPRHSYSYQEPLSKIKLSNNPNVFHFDLSRIGLVKVRGWNKKLRFINEETDFLKWASSNPKEKITVTVNKDFVGDYYIIFKIKKCLKPFATPICREGGIDVGIKDIAICSDGKKFENRRFKKLEKRHQKLINRKMSRRWGPSNEVFREARRKNRAERKAFLNIPEHYEGQKPPEMIQPSKGYLKAKAQHSKLNRKISRQRDLWNHEISKKLFGTTLLLVWKLLISPAWYETGI